MKYICYKCFYKKGNERDKCEDSHDQGKNEKYPLKCCSSEVARAFGNHLFDLFFC